MTKENVNFVFSAIAGQEDMKAALILNAVNPALGGVLIRGEKGTAKSTAVRALADLMPLIGVVPSCPCSCNPDDAASLCDECEKRLADEGSLPQDVRRMKVVELPISATEDRVVGTLNMEHAIKTGEKKFEYGILAAANRNILYVDEVNLLDDHIVDVLLDSAAMGVNTVEREGVSYSHPARFILVGTMNPEEGDLRPQLLDRFGLSVTVRGETDIETRIRVIENRLAYENDPESFSRIFEEEQKALSRRIASAREILGSVTYTRQTLLRIAEICISLNVDGHRADIAILKTAMTAASLEGRTDVSEADVIQAARYVLPHRLRRLPFEGMPEDAGELAAKL